MALHSHTDEPPAWDVLTDSEFDLLVVLNDLRAEIAALEDQIRGVQQRLATVRDKISRRDAAENTGS